MIATAPPQLREINQTLGAIRVHFSEYFDRGWLAMLIDELPIDFTTVRDVRGMLSRHSVYQEDLHELVYGVSQLRVFCRELRRQLVPVMRDRLGISGLSQARRAMNATERVHRELICYAFPYNLARLETLTEQLASLCAA